ncbi:MAG: YebC/PmpR family DNA-binding transcriptional regulator [Deltaproteobacteria bacterium]|nr:YebC/PmpR family DNA-binding transcriptional regulator [Deltaproteobacteria bacterium]
MSGHSKWSKIKHTKGAADAKRGKIFTKIIREITTAARIGGGDPGGNPRLRKAIDSAKAQNMPNDNIDRAVKKGTGELGGVQYEEIRYEGYGPGGVAILAEVMTDNKNRTVAEIRHIFSKYNGSMAAAGSVSWLFKEKGLVACDKTAVSEDQLMEVALDAGAEDIVDGGDEWVVSVPANAYFAVKETLEKAKIAIARSELTKVPDTTVRVSGKDAETNLKLVEALEDHDDVQNVYANFDIADEEMTRLAATA